MRAFICKYSAKIYAHSGEVCRQGDQIGRFFAHWAIVTFFKTVFEELAHVFFLNKIYATILTKNGLGHILGELFTNSSGHPACMYVTFMRSPSLSLFLRAPCRIPVAFIFFSLCVAPLTLLNPFLVAICHQMQILGRDSNPLFVRSPSKRLNNAMAVTNLLRGYKDIQ
jgi:hypothetical protein